MTYFMKDSFPGTGLMERAKTMSLPQWSVQPKNGARKEIRYIVREDR